MLLYSNTDFHHGRAAIAPELAANRECMVAYAGCVPWARISCGGHERVLRQDLALAHRLADRHGITESIWTHMTAKLNDRVVLMTPFGLEYSEVNASSLISMELATGEPGIPTRHTYALLNPAALPLHRAVYAACDGCTVSIHAHHPSLSVVSALEEGFMAVDQSFFNLPPIYYYSSSHQLSSPYDLTEERRLTEAINHTSGGLVVLRGHGVVSFGKSVSSAYTRLWYAVRTASIQERLMTAGSQSSTPLATFDVPRVMENSKIMSLYNGELGLEFEAWRRTELKASDSFMY
eukprot:gnl/TRDRNA2_/TRDRNA2_34845_c0_seq1.p1 gnl/TRDRNA2_/TRDRNA2_34845_c0~~gnl/TRDRNA2_/TRDRNA2_34845_c0_seq1.p1  ORF type:complete len:332 (-),score=28.13 gnl/TRDRNA2_/TRDRNA2_34845_c0_seq1:44-919(-)